MKKNKSLLVTVVLIVPAILAGCGQGTYFIFTEDYMAALGNQASAGDIRAIDRIEAEYQRLYKDIDCMEGPLPGKTMGRSTQNLVLMNAAFDPIGQAAGRGNEAAMRALRYAAKKDSIRGFVPDALGIAAAHGNKEALEMLLHYADHGFLESSTIFALEPAARTNIPEAVQFMLTSLADPTDRPIHHVAVSGLTGAARTGNLAAKEAVVAFLAPALEAEPTWDRLQALTAIDRDTAMKVALRLFREPTVHRQKKYLLGQYLLRSQTPPEGRRPNEAPGFITEYRQFLVASIMDGGAKEFCQQRDFGTHTAVGEFAGIAAGEQGRPSGILFSDIRDKRVVPVLIECLNAPADVSRYVANSQGMNRQRDIIPLALARLQAVEAIPRLREIAEGHPSEVFRRNAEFALDALIPLAEAQKGHNKAANQVPEDTARKLADPQH